ncbi:hypothetical protein [Metabacillus bambusae]|uniref:Zinc-binding domain-containing protein n=1 Tax=Metabacillus bambusae TaxID=2795218 RepID=A0ABS3N648_9BACI|nr:hypothetical protein [Metabacillus bambusae]MBO1513520.1 hypothetical protein [Metabacillus bambusae]
MDLKLKDKDVLIRGISLPRSFQISLEKRGKTAVNHRFMEGVEELQIYCSSCNRWHPVYRLENRTWVDINETYKLCNPGKEREYFDTYCSQCYTNRHKKDGVKTLGKEAGVVGEKEEIAEDKERVSESGEEVKYLPWSEKAGGVQQTIFLAPDLDMYLRLYGVYHSKKKNELLNDIIAEFKSKNPINL